MSTPSLSQYLETLRRIAIELGPQRSFLSALRFVLHVLTERHAFQRPHLVIFDPEAHALRLCLAQTPPSSEGIYEPGVGITGQVFTLGRPVIVDRISQNPVFQNKLFCRTPEEMHSLAFLSVPVLGHGQVPSEGLDVLGVLSTDTPVASRAALEDQCRFLEVIAGLVATQVGYWQQEKAREQLATGFAPAQEGDVLRTVVVSKAMRGVLARANQAAASPVTPLLRGEAGTGKAMIAERIHQLSPRRDLPLISFNCAQVPREEMEIELFGVQKGGQPKVLQTRKGIVERAHLGTLYVQNLEVLPLALQHKMLCAMHEGRVYRMGSTAPVQINVRFICATRRSMLELRREGLLDEDMLLHFSAWTIDIPPLRERGEDILPLAEFFLHHEAQVQGKAITRISRAAAGLLLQYAWPGNAHELKNCMQRAVGKCSGHTLYPEHLPPSLQCGEGGQEDSLDAPTSFATAVAQFEQTLLMDALRKAGGNMLEASRLLDASYRVVNYKVKKYALDPRAYAAK